ncbi:MAG: MurR/RpiR family transcriptional regulator [Pseudomonadota bacterium]|jgi:DNA-binding MurR/RpiR family transcriptional regulator|nr:MurR/RpiR family transcriptional regulator [Xanthomonadaceae bacterium]MDE2247626.1 MurR/RpiR family transcriptional regulator [Xanthomonadaceae bacterium]MDE3210021.1 MurR/RpiR family transcriptional regulator [Pseudomonadota bacterium]
MIKNLQKKLKGGWDAFTTSEQKIATYLLHNPGAIPFETAASLGQRVGVSAMTVGRFLRNLGYAGLNELKEELRGDAPWLQLYKNPDQAGDPATMSESLQAEIRGVTIAHALTRSAEWKSVVRLLVDADRVSVASFHQGRFLGLGFASLMQHVKPRTVFDEGLDGAYTDMLLDSTEKSCVLLIDFRRYSRHFRILAEEAVARGIPLAIITDSQCYWARQLTSHVLMLPAEMERPWHNFTAATSLLSLLIGAVTREQGDMFDRIGDITQLRQRLVGYVEAPVLEKKPRPQGAGKPARGKPRARPKG